MTKLTERDYDIMMVGSKFRIRRPNGEILRFLGKIVTCNTVEEAEQHIRKIVDHANSMGL